MGSRDFLLADSNVCNHKSEIVQFIACSGYLVATGLAKLRSEQASSVLHWSLDRSTYSALRIDFDAFLGRES